jgi:folate-binding protein YgfZ
MNENPVSAEVFDGALRLDDWIVLRAQGADAATFLQGQLTQDVMTLAPGQARLAGYCSAKGRLLASFIVWRMGDDAYGLLCSADVAAQVAKRLSMYVLRARCRIDVASADWVVHGMAGPCIARVLGEPLSAWRTQLRDQAWWLGMPPVDGVARALLVQGPQAAAPALPRLHEQAWQWLEVSSGVPRIVAATAEQFVPQMINFDLVEGVNFQKGCYPGQEVVARSQYRGTLKRRMHLFATSAIASPGQELFHSGDPSQPAGMVVNAASWPGAGARLLAEVKIAALDAGTLHLAQAQGAALERLPLPYSMPDTASV